MKHILRRARILVEDRLRFSPLIRRLVSYYRVIADILLPQRNDQALARSIHRLCGAARLAASEPMMLSIERRIARRVAQLDSARPCWSEFFDGIEDPWIEKAAILKPYISPHEKGVLFISFEDQWMKLLRHCDLRELAARYTLVVSPTWSPPHALASTVFPAAFPDPIVTLISNAKDLAYLPRLSKKFVVVPLLASSWVNPSFYRPRPRAERDIDIVMVANCGKYKRHHALFRALAGMRRGLKVLIVCQAQDRRTPDTIRAEAGAFGVDAAVTLWTNLSDGKVAEGLCRAKVSVIMSRREGSCVVVSESLFADTPVGLLSNAAIGSRTFINSGTGRLLNERRLAAELESFLDAAPSYSPRLWAEQNISCFRSTQILNGLLKRHAHECGQVWTQDIATLCWRPNPQLVEPAARERLEPERDEIKHRFGVEIGSPILQEAFVAAH